MQALFQTIIRLYPEEYRAIFGEEMLGVLTDRKAELNKRGVVRGAWLAVTETASLLRAIVSEHLAKRTNPKGYGYFSAHAHETDDLPSDPIALQSRLKDLIRLMERAIAHHDFPRARFYSNEERKTRNLLSNLQNVHSFQKKNPQLESIAELRE